MVYNKDPGDNETHAVDLDPTGGKGFVNQKVDGMSLMVKKEWSTGSAGSTEIQVALRKDGTVIDTQTLSSANGWSYTWTKLNVDSSYDVIEEVVGGYIPTYTTSYETIAGNSITTTNEAVLYRKDGNTLTKASQIEVGKEYVIGNQDKTKLLYVSDGHADAAFTAADTISYTPGSVIDSRCVYIAEHTATNSRNNIILHNTAAGSFILAQNNSNTYLKYLTA